MVTLVRSFDPMGHKPENTHESETLWCRLYPSLTFPVWQLVRNAGVSSWRGQEADIVEEIIQESIARTFFYMRKAENNQVMPIHSLPQFCKRVAANYCRDLQRKEMRLVRSISIECNSDGYEGEDTLDHWASPTDPIVEALEHIAFIAFLAEIAPIIATFPTKQRTTLLIDLANLADFGNEPGPLEGAFLEVGIDLRAYQQELPTERKLRSRHCSLLSTAYRRLRETAYPHLCQLGLA